MGVPYQNAILKLMAGGEFRDQDARADRISKAPFQSAAI